MREMTKLLFFRGGHNMKNIIHVAKLINSPAALTVEQGNLLYTEIANLLKKNEENIIIDFADIESIITPFLNESIGRLYGEFTGEELNKRLSIINQPVGTNRKFNMVIRNAKQFYSNKEEYTKIVKKVLDE